jgi:chromosome segregation ATPase
VLADEKRKLAKEHDLAVLEIEGETEEQKRGRLTANRAEAARDLDLLKTDLERIDTRLSVARAKKKDLDEAAERTRRELGTLNETLKRQRAELAANDEQIAELEGKRVDQQEKAHASERVMRNIALQIGRLGARARPVEKSNGDIQRRRGDLSRAG